MAAREAAGGGSCAVYLVNGIKLSGFLVAHDQKCLFLRSESVAGKETTSLIMKAAVSMIIPMLSDQSSGVDLNKQQGMLRGTDSRN
jgi:sRNA-binding regulator protein Hfq